MDSNICQINKPKTVHTLQCTLYTVHYIAYRPEFKLLEPNQERVHMGELLLWLISRLGFISTIGKLDSMFII